MIHIVSINVCSDDGSRCVDADSHSPLVRFVARSCNVEGGYLARGVADESMANLFCIEIYTRNCLPLSAQTPSPLRCSRQGDNLAFANAIWNSNIWSVPLLRGASSVLLKNAYHLKSLSVVPS
jgi:hypothetical protein